MYRTVIIASALFLSSYSAFPQLGPVSGDIRYEHQYQDVLVNGSLVTSLRRSPSINLTTSGSIRSEKFIFYSIRTGLTAGFRTSQSSQSLVETRNILWNAYNVNVFFLQTAPVNFQLASREYANDTRYEYQGLRSRGGTRDHEDRIGLSLVRVPFVPLINLTFTRNKSWSVVGEPFEQRTHQYVFSASSRNGVDGHASVTGSLSEFREKYSGFSERILSLQFDGSRTLSERHQVTVGSEYSKYASYSALSAGASYAGELSGAVRINSGLNGQNASSRNYSIRTVSASQRIQIVQDKNFTWGLGAGGATGVTILPQREGRERIPTNDWNANLNLNHVRSLGGLSVANNVALTYGRRNYLEELTYYRLGVTNSANRNIGKFLVNATYNFSYLENRNSGSWRSTEHFAMLNLTGTFPPSIRSRSTADFRSYDYGGDRLTASDQSTLNLAQSFDGSFRHVIPFTLSAGASVHYFFAGLRGHSYGWNTSFQSSQFFLKDLSASYRYSRSFDPYYRRESLEQTARLSYRWRLLNLQLTLRERTVFSRLRDVRFSVERSL